MVDKQIISRHGLMVDNLSKQMVCNHFFRVILAAQDNGLMYYQDELKGYLEAAIFTFAFIQNNNRIMHDDAMFRFLDIDDSCE